MKRHLPAPRRLAFGLALALYAPTFAQAGPYSPAAGQPGSDAISFQDSRIVEWASGFSDYVQGSPINPTYTNPQETLGPAKGTTTGVTELGDGGQITLSFARPIVAGASGPDFAVFGNAFDDSYLKLAYVEVSQDGRTWYTMPNHSLTAGPVPTFGNSMDPTDIDGLAGKFRVGYGTPFSLSAVGLASADYVRLVDVVGDGSEKDSAGNPIYDPTPRSDGFNAAGVGVLSAAPVPEPGSVVTMVLGVGLLAAARRSRRGRPTA